MNSLQIKEAECQSQFYSHLNPIVFIAIIIRMADRLFRTLPVIFDDT